MILQQKEISKRIYYLSGWEALNIPDENGLIADWHPSLYFKDNQPLKFYLNKENPILQNMGIKKRFVPMLNKSYYIASFARAIADLLYNGEFKELKNCSYDFLTTKDEKELFTYLKLIKDRNGIENFMKYELTKLYFEDKNV